MRIQMSKRETFSHFLFILLIRQAHVYIIAGACLSLGFRFAGSENLAAFKCLVRGFYFFPSISIEV